jgi:hypothetical protein
MKKAVFWDVYTVPHPRRLLSSSLRNVCTTYQFWYGCSLLFHYFKSKNNDQIKKDSKFTNTFRRVITENILATNCCPSVCVWYVAVKISLSYNFVIIHAKYFELPATGNYKSNT